MIDPKYICIYITYRGKLFENRNQLLKDIYSGRETSTCRDKFSKKFGQDPRPVIKGLGQHLVAPDSLTLGALVEQLVLEGRSPKDLNGKSGFHETPGLQS